MIFEILDVLGIAYSAACCLLSLNNEGLIGSRLDLAKGKNGMVETSLLLLFQFDIKYWAVFADPCLDLICNVRDTVEYGYLYLSLLHL